MSSEQNELRYCVDCKFHSDDHCYAPKGANTVYVVSGAGGMSCIRARSDDGRCGVHADWFEPEEENEFIFQQIFGPIFLRMKA